MNALDRAVERVRIGLVDFEPIRIAGLREIFASRTDVEVVDTDWAGAFRNSDFDLVVFVLRDMAFSLALLARLRARHPGLRVMVMSSASDEERIVEAITAGARGWLAETASPDEVMRAAEVVLDGTIWAPRRVLSTVVERAVEGSTWRQRRQNPQFTEREEEVLQQLVLARSNREIAQALSIREQTVKSYVARLMRKVGVGNRIALSVHAASENFNRNHP
ncbi:MAG TPA: response regulator transcription factor [Acidobacteriaceae bacterium]|jgi:DNA-binding NarL/FixJ family response regulator|nr:response regulator transcription factor [Acidobacteriaceae bacterium]